MQKKLYKSSHTEDITNPMQNSNKISLNVAQLNTHEYDYSIFCLWKPLAHILLKLQHHSKQDFVVVVFFLRISSTCSNSFDIPWWLPEIIMLIDKKFKLESIVLLGPAPKIDVIISNAHTLVEGSIT